jgi:hypothetical protein
MARRSRTGHSVLAVAAVLLLAGPAAAAGHMALQAGGFVPFQGDAGPSFLLQLLGSNASARARFGGEFEYRGFDTTIMGVRNVDVDSYAIRAVWQQHFMPDAPVTPYIGLGIGVSINDVDDDKVDRVYGRNVRHATGAGPDGVFMLGVQAKIPGLDFMSIYGEGRVGFSYDFSGRADKDATVETENFGGASGSGGIRFRF